MSTDGAVGKRPSEKFPIDFDFAPDLAVGETLTGTPTVTSKNAATGADTSSTFLTGSPTISGSKVIIKIQAGTHGERHIVTFKVDTSNSNKFQGDVSVPVLEAEGA